MPDFNSSTLKSLVSHSQPLAKEIHIHRQRACENSITITDAIELHISLIRIPLCAAKSMKQKKKRNGKVNQTVQVRLVDVCWTSSTKVIVLHVHAVTVECVVSCRQHVVRGKAQRIVRFFLGGVEVENIVSRKRAVQHERFNVVLVHKCHGGIGCGKFKNRISKV